MAFMSPLHKMNAYEGHVHPKLLNEHTEIRFWDLYQYVLCKLTFVPDWSSPTYTILTDQIELYQFRRVAALHIGKRSTTSTLNLSIWLMLNDPRVEMGYNTTTVALRVAENDGN
jgi:hypothetical protein